jgi:hypothetical protein
VPSGIFIKEKVVSIAAAQRRKNCNFFITPLGGVICPETWNNFSPSASASLAFAAAKK